MLNGSSSTTSIEGQHCMFFLTINVLTDIDLIIIGVLFSSKSLLTICLFSRMNENVEPLPN